MNPFEIDAKKIRQFIRFLRERGASAGTMEKYQRDLRRFAAWLDGTPASREAAVRWRESLLAEGCRPATVNSMLA
ncbi:MAG TPA: site-specific integrase, partial [Candidatus Merdivicinus intestinavium]|nr:site-specific integrase [Candidatus Merdivicinus intestinavium]HIQ59519.1 site-specific integrase [Candidatus Merdivicinus intestinavium]